MNEVFEKIFERLEKEKNKDRIGVYSEIQCDAIKFAYGSAKEIVQEVAEEYATDTNVGTNGWIPVEERMPEESLNSVIGWDAYRERCVFVQYLQGQWKLGDWESVNITHWMNVPEPPKGA